MTPSPNNSSDEGWQDIATAPKDGEAALFLSPEGHVGIGVITTSKFGEDEFPHGTAAWCGRRDGDLDTRDRVWLGGYSPLEATHWMPLPARPEQGQ